jgi:hypothetical protein
MSEPLVDVPADVRRRPRLAVEFALGTGVVREARNFGFRAAKCCDEIAQFPRGGSRLDQQKNSRTCLRQRVVHPAAPPRAPESLGVQNHLERPRIPVNYKKQYEVLGIRCQRISQ